MMSFSYILRKSTGSNKFTKSQEKIYHFMSVDDMKLFVKKWKTSENFDDINKNIQPTRIRNVIQISSTPLNKLTLCRLHAHGQRFVKVEE